MKHHFASTTSGSFEALLTENEQLRRQIADLEDRLHEAEGTIHAVRCGEVDAVVVGEDPQQMQVHTLLAANRHYLYLAQEVLRVAIWDWDLAAGRLSHCHRLPEILGHNDLQTLRPEGLLALLHPADRDRIRNRFEEAIVTGEPVSEEFRIVSRDGQQRWMACAAQVAEQTITGRHHVVGVCLDVTANKETEEALFTSELRLREILDNIATLVYIVDTQNRFTFINRRWSHVFGFTDEHARGRSIYDFFPRQTADQFAAHNREVLQSRTPLEFEEIVPHADGEHTYISVKFPLSDAAGEPDAVCGVSLDITERKQAEMKLRQREEQLVSLNKTLDKRVEQRTRELKRQADQLRRLAGELSETEQRERSKLAQVLHDGLQQVLVGTKMQLTLCTGPDAAKHLSRVRELLDESIEMSRSLAYELSPPVLQHAGLAESLQWLAKWSAETHGLEVRIDGDSEIPAVSESTRLVVFQAVRELALNAVKHAGVATVHVRIRSTADCIEIEVQDEGRGFDPQDVASNEQGGLGLFSVRERLFSVGGRLDIHSSPGAGSRFVLSLPRPDGST